MVQLKIVGELKLVFLLKQFTDNENTNYSCSTEISWPNDNNTTNNSVVLILVC